MKTKGKGNTAKETTLELKYCERCGSLWLRPGGEGQVYCAACSLAMNEMPPASGECRGTQRARVPLGPQWGASDGDFDGYDDDGMDIDAVGGVA